MERDISAWLSAFNGGSAGYLGGTNSAGLKGYGNLFMTAHGNAHITGVNVYFAFKPTKYPADAKLMLRVWYPMESEGNMEFTGLPLEVVELPVSEIRDAYEGEFPIKNVAVGEFRLNSLCRYGTSLCSLLPLKVLATIRQSLISLC